MAPKNVYEHLKAQWKPEWTALPSVADLSVHFDRLAAAPAAVAAVKREQVSSGKLSALGIREKVREAASRAVPDLRRAFYALEGAKAAVAAQRKLLMASPVDKSDIVGAMVRQEIRAKLAAMDQGERMALMQSDPRVMEAWRELPIFAPIPAEFERELEEKRLEERDPEAMQRMREANDAIVLVEAALRAATDDLRDEAEFDQRSKEFQEFFDEVAAPLDAEFAKASKVDDSMNVDALVAMHRKRHGLPAEASA